MIPAAAQWMYDATLPDWCAAERRVLLPKSASSPFLWPKCSPVSSCVIVGNRSEFMRNFWSTIGFPPPQLIGVLTSIQGSSRLPILLQDSEKHKKKRYNVNVPRGAPSAAPGPRNEDSCAQRMCLSRWMSGMREHRR
jgi:hypothetical protein